jgi:zinc protease
VIREGPGTVAYLQICHHVPAVDSEDYMPLLVMDAALTGPPQMSFSGGGGTNRSSRLYQALVETELATSVGGSLFATRDPYVYDLSATVRSGQTIETVEKAILDELTKMASGSIKQTEIEKAIKQSKAQFAYATERVTNQAYWLGWMETIASYDWFETYIERLGAVTVDDVQRVTQAYLRPANRTVGWYVPQEGRENR